MTFSHNRHYQRLLLRHVPRDCRRALDAGCGRGEFAERLALRAGRVDAFDVDPEMVHAARGGAGRGGAGRNTVVRQADLLDAQLDQGTYDFVSCISVIHHLPFEKGALALREALAPGGTLVVLGLYREATFSDRGLSLIAVPVNAICRVAHALARTAPQGAMPVRVATQPLAEIREAAARVLPGASIRRLLFWRYVLVYREPG